MVVLASRASRFLNIVYVKVCKVVKRRKSKLWDGMREDRMVNLEADWGVTFIGRVGGRLTFTDTARGGRRGTRI